MTDLWYPAAILNPAPESLWGSYRDDDGQWKYLLHSTEADVYRPNPNNYYGHTSYPHATIGNGVDDRLHTWQHIPINRAARALKNKPGGVETNADRVVQVEIVGRAAQSPGWPTELLDLVKDFGLWMAAETGMPWQCSVCFAAGGVGVRLDGPTFDNYAGILGHMHAPENDHVDPGAINVAYLLDIPAPPEPPSPDPQPHDESEFSMLPRCVHWNGAIFLVGYDNAKFDGTVQDAAGGIVTVTGATGPWRRTFPNPSRLQQIVGGGGCVVNAQGNAFEVTNNQFAQVYVDRGPA